MSVTLSPISINAPVAVGIKGDQGDAGTNGSNGISSYLYIGYAEDDQGTGYSASPGGARTYIAFKYSATVIASPDASTFSGLWKKYVGDNGSSVNLANPGPIGGTTPSTGAFTTLALTPPANTSSLTLTGFSLTGSNAQSMIDLSGTWNTSGTPTASKINITNTGSNASSLFFDYQLGGTSTINGRIDGVISVRGTSNISGESGIKSAYGNTGLFFSQYYLGLRTNGAWIFRNGDGDIPTFLNAVGLTSSSAFTGAADLVLRRISASVLQIGETHATTGTAITLRGMAVTTGTGGDLILSGGTGSVASGKVRIGTHSAVGAETITGYITIKDEGGTERKIAVIS